MHIERGGRALAQIPLRRHLLRKAFISSSSSESIVALEPEQVVFAVHHAIEQHRRYFGEQGMQVHREIRFSAKVNSQTSKATFLTFVL